MKEKLRKKLNSKSGESLSETLVALLIAALALVMLAGAVSASFRVVTDSEERINKYYDANELANGVVNMGGTGVGTATVTLKAPPGTIKDQTWTVNYYMNNTFTARPVITYKNSVSP